MLGTQPDLAYSVIKMSQFSANPTEDHLKRALYIVQYLATIRDLCLSYQGMLKDGFLAYSDTD